jgi:hypothetical protein
LPSKLANIQAFCEIASLAPVSMRAASLAACGPSTVNAAGVALASAGALGPTLRVSHRVWRGGAVKKARRSSFAPRLKKLLADEMVGSIRIDQRQQLSHHN